MFASVEFRGHLDSRKGLSLPLLPEQIVDTTGLGIPCRHLCPEVFSLAIPFPKSWRQLQSTWATIVAIGVLAMACYERKTLYCSSVVLKNNAELV